MALQNYEMNDLLLVVVGIAGALGGLCLSIQHSKCKKINICFGLFHCDRDVQAVIDEEKLRLGKTISPRKPPVLESMEPEPENEVLIDP